MVLVGARHAQGCVLPGGAPGDRYQTRLQEPKEVCDLQGMNPADEEKKK